MSKKEVTHYSDRGFPLMVREDVLRPTLTVEDYTKWYAFYILYPSGLVSKFYQEYLYDNFEGAAWCDHVPNPAFYDHVCDQLDLEPHERSREVIVGRWYTEVVNCE
jgi:hypothetical protein